MALTTIPHVEIARVGEWVASTGPWKCTREQIADAQRAYEAKMFRVPRMRRGHTDERFDGDVQAKGDGEPALGILRNVTVGNDGNSLFADLRLPSDLAEDLPAIYPHRSIEADLGVKTADGHEFAMVVTGLALLGERPPAIHSLEELPDMDESPMAYVAASSLAASIPLAAGFWDENLHPRGGKGSAAGGKFVAKGSGYKDKKDGQGTGEEADTVRAVQKELLRLGLLSADSGKNGGADGLFGPRTEAAVKKWQTQHGHAATGKVSEQLLKTLKLAKKGDKGEAQKLADHPHKGAKTPAKPAVKVAKPKHGLPKTRVQPPNPSVKAPTKPHGTYPNRGAVPFNARIAERVKAAADQVAETLDLETIDVTDTGVIWTDGDGFPWIAGWEEWTSDESIRLAAPEPAQVTYERVAASDDESHVPYVSGLGSATAASLGASSVDITQLREALGLDDSADESAALAAIAALKSTAEAPPAPETVETVSTHAQTDDRTSTGAPVNVVEPAPAVDVEALVAAKAREQVAAAMGEYTAGQTVLRDEVTRLSTELAGRKQAEAVTKRETLLASAVQAGKIHPAAKQHYADLYDASPKAIEDLFASLAPNTAFTVQASGYAGDDKVTSEVDQLIADMGYGVSDRG